MVSVIILSAIVLYVDMLSVLMQRVVVLIVFMLCSVYAESYANCQFAVSLW
jgi:hypothetical protein